MAPVRWFKGETEIRDSKKYSLEKNVLGHCKLNILNPTENDSGLYKCKIDNTKFVTKCAVTLKGNKNERLIMMVINLFKILQRKRTSS